MKPVEAVTTDLVGTLGRSILSRVTEEHRLLAADAIGWFTDRPAAAGIDDTMTALKLAAHLSRNEVSREELMQMVLWLDTTTTFQPVLVDFLRALDHVRSERRRQEIAKYKTYLDGEGRAWVCSEENAVENGWIEEAVALEQMRKAGLKDERN